MHVSISSMPVYVKSEINKYCTILTQYIITYTGWEAGIKKKNLVISVIKKLNHCYSKCIKTANYYIVIPESSLLEIYYFIPQNNLTIVHFWCQGLRLFQILAAIFNRLLQRNPKPSYCAQHIDNFHIWKQLYGSPHYMLNNIGTMWSAWC